MQPGILCSRSTLQLGILTFFLNFSELSSNYYGVLIAYVSISLRYYHVDTVPHTH